ncbi:MAG: anhydro-N-acetylmuramic acid kinase, partial [Bacteroidales bacterium]|nr:anhydro-N-acetylmuramic acid kinase [Bacteroidales bacterium]
MEIYQVIGIMSGTSLDGLDIAYCTFRKEKDWKFEILLAETIDYPMGWITRLRNLPQSSASEYAKTHADYGHFIGKEIKKFIQKHQIDVDFISSHGHTIFHQPELGFTAQIGDGAAIAAETEISVINDFRSMDIAFKGQGAPLVPIGDRYLFSEFDFRLNLGGFANISFEKNGSTYAFDIAPANIALNHFANQIDLAFDK